MKMTCNKCLGFGYTSWNPYVECSCGSKSGVFKAPFYHWLVMKVYRHFSKIIEKYNG